MNTCKECKHWTRDSLDIERFPEYKNHGSCALFGDANEGTPRHDVCYGSDYEGYKAEVVVMANFGCIHWEK